MHRRPTISYFSKTNPICCRHLWQLLLLFKLFKLNRGCSVIGWVYPLRTVDSTLFPKIIRLITPPIPSDTLETGMVMIMIIVMCAQYGIQYLMTIYPPVILFMPIKPTQKNIYVFNIFSFKSAKFLEVKCVFSLNLTVFKV